MAGLGLQAAGGLSALQATLRQRMEDDLKRKQLEFENQIALRTAGRQDLQLQQQGELTRAQLQALQENRAAVDADRVFKENMTLQESIPGGREIPAQSPIAGRLMAIGAGVPKGIEADTPPMLAAPGQAASAEVPGTVANAPSLTGRMIRKLPSQKQLDTDADNARQAARDAVLAKQADTSASAKIEQLNQAAQRLEMQGKLNEANILRAQAQAALANAKAEGGGPLKRVEHRDQDTGETVIEYLTDAQLRGQKFTPKAGAVTENRVTSAKAVNQTGEDIIRKLSDPTYAATVGPIMGRSAKLGDLVGNPPPEFAELAGTIESYALANMGVHGMRSTQGAQVIKELLDQRHTPESLVSTIKGLNQFSTHLMQNERDKAKPSGGGKKKYELIKD